eukprot:ctg_5782.g643
MQQVVGGLGDAVEVLG